jgi:hypothetical protein
MDGAKFSEVMQRMIPPHELEQLCAEFAPRARGGRKLGATELVQSLIFHQLCPGGTLARHGTQLHGVAMSDAAYARRRARLPVQMFEALMDAALSPLADPQLHPQCFFAGYRVVGIDGSQSSVSNTAAILEALPKAASRRFKAAFAKLRLLTLVELGTHAPLAARAAPVGESEQALAEKLWASVPEGSLVVADRLFGAPLTLHRAQSAWGERDIAFLVRIRENLKAQIIERLPDGSALIEVPVREDGKLLGRARWREIRARGRSIDGKAFELRLWTSLLDEKRFSAEALARRYAERWEHELYYRELKLDVRNRPLLAGHTVETALQELCAIVLATALIARLRVEAASAAKVPPTRVSFYKLMLEVEPLWNTERLLGDSLTRAQREQMLAKFYENVRRWALLPERRARSCPRVVRQPVTKWPRKTTQRSHTGEVRLAITRI